MTALGAPPHTSRLALFGALYGDDFDAPPVAETPEPAEPEPPVVVEPVYSAAALDAARMEGQEAGRIACERGLAATRVHMLGLIAEALGAAQAEAAISAEAFAAMVARTMLSAVAACLPTLCAQHGEAELRAVARALLPSLVDEPRITITVNPVMIPALTEEISLFDAAMLDRVVFLPMAALPPGDLRVGWRDGGAVRDAARVRMEVESVLAKLGLLQRETIDV